MRRILLLSIISVAILPLISNSQTLYFGGSGTWTGAGWSINNTAPYTTSWVTGRVAEFNIPNSTITGASTTFSSITANENVTVTSGGTMNTGGTIATITVASGKTFDFGTQKISSAAGTGLIKNGSGVLAIQTTSSLYPIGITINDGTLICVGVNALGGGSLVINGGILAGSGNRDFSGKQSSITFGGDFALGAITGLASSTANLTFDAPVTLGAACTITLNGIGNNTFSGVISGSKNIALGTGSTGFLTLSGANNYSGTTTLSGGTLKLGGAGVIPDASKFTLNGGTLKTGAFSESYARLNLAESSNIILDPSVQTHTFIASNGIPWTSGKTLTVTGWAGGYNGTSGTAGKIFFGNSATDLTTDQLDQIKFFNGIVNYDAAILSTGEVVPNTITVLPISLTSFTAKPIDKSILLNWATASEKNNQQFEVLKSADGNSFKTIATVDGAVNSDTEKSYTFADENPYSGANYYQLKQTDLDGTSTFSKVIVANAKIEDIKISVFVSNSAVTVSVNSPNQTDGQLALFDMNGRKLEDKNLILNKGFNEVVFNKTLIPGTYFINLISAGKSTSVKFIK